MGQGFCSTSGLWDASQKMGTSRALSRFRNARVSRYVDPERTQKMVEVSASVLRDAALEIFDVDPHASLRFG